MVFAWLIAAVRWRILLSPTLGLRIRDTFAYITIGYLANTVLPLRLGDLARATLIGRNKSLGISRSLGSMAFERVLDLLTLLAFTFALSLLMELPPIIQTGVASMTGLAFGALLLLVVMALSKKKLDLFTRLMVRCIPRHFAGSVTTLVTNFVSGVDIVNRPRRLISVIVLSVMVWGCAGLATWAWVAAFRLDVPWFAPFFVLVVINLGSAIPSSPGYIGVYHYLAVLALSVFGIERSPALAYAIGTHALNMIANVSLGAFFLSSQGVSLRELRGED